MSHRTLEGDEVICGKDVNLTDDGRRYGVLLAFVRANSATRPRIGCNNYQSNDVSLCAAGKMVQGSVLYSR